MVFHLFQVLTFIDDLLGLVISYSSRIFIEKHFKLDRLEIRGMDYFDRDIISRRVD